MEVFYYVISFPNLSILVKAILHPCLSVSSLTFKTSGFKDKPTEFFLLK